MAGLKIKKILKKVNIIQKTVKKKTAKVKIVVKKKVIKKVVKKVLANKKKVLKLKRSILNPIIEPESKSYWDSRATFNPSAIIYDGKVHVIYRAVGDTDISVLGYAESKDGLYFNRNGKRLAYYSKGRNVNKETEAQISYSSGGGGGGGCEDPRLTLLGDKVYMIYTLFDGWGSLRLALTSISLQDFINKRFHWKEPVLISPPGEIHKNWVIFPEKIKGKYAILHAISPKILIDYLDDMGELNGKKFIKSVHQGHPDWQKREKGMRGIGGAPVKTKYGWLVLFHKDHDSKYEIFAMLLDLKDPTKVLYRSAEPILEPEEWYENEGYKSGVIYTCGTVIKDKKLFVYYGGADTVSCVAMADLDKFLKDLMRTGKTKLISKKSKK